MNTVSEDILQRANTVGEKLAGSRLPISLARLYSHQTRIAAGQAGLSSWRTEEALDLLRDAETLIEAAFLKREVPDLTWQRDLRRSAEIFEWLSSTGSLDESVPSIMLSAAAYQLAGYPARALGVLKGNLIEDTQSQIIKSFLDSNFRQLQIDLCRFWQDVKKTPNASVTKSSFEDTLGGMIIDQTIRSLGLICAWFRWGEESRIEKAIEKMRAISRAMIYGPSAYSWLLARLVSEITTEYINGSLRKNIREMELLKGEEGNNALERYIRLAFLSNAALTWPSQRDGLKKIKAGISFAQCTPTGSGKTRIAELAILESLFPPGQETNGEETYPAALYLVPSRALASEVESKMDRVLRQTGGESIAVTSLYGGTDWGPSDAFLKLDQRVLIISTQEKAEALMRFLGKPFIDRVRLVVIDEAHTVEYKGSGDDLRDSNNRALHLETFVNRLMTLVEGKNCKFVALSAVAPGIEWYLARWVGRTPDAEPVTTQYQSTRQLVGRLLCFPNRRVQIRYDLLDGQNLAVKGAHEDDSPYIPEPFPPHPIASYFENLGPEKKLRPHLFWSAMNLAARGGKDQHHSVLISVTQQIGGYADDFLKLLDKTWKREELPHFFSEPESNNKKEKFVKCLKSCKDYFGEQSHEYRLLSRGVVVHHGKMPGIMSRMLVDLIQDGVVNVVLATSTLTEGVNLPFEIILIPSLRRAGIYISAREFGNLIGRAGRPGISTEGRSLIMMDPTSTSPGQYGTRKAYFELIGDIAMGTSQITQSVQNRGPLSSLLLYIEKKWMEISRGSSTENFISWLESTICEEVDDESHDAITALDTLDGILVGAIEEAEEQFETDLKGSDLESFLRNLWRNSFSFYSSQEEGRLGRMFIARGRGIVSRIYPQKEYRKKLYRTSLPPREGKLMINEISRIRESLEEGDQYYTWSPTERVVYIASLVEKIQLVPSFLLHSPPRNTSWREILHWWLDPGSAPRLPSPIQVSVWYNYAAQNFGYRFNWGLGCILGVLIESVSDQISTIDRWIQLGLPWSVFWFKDLITWGILDPVAAYLLIKGKVDTRSEANEEAKKYWNRYRGRESDSLFDPRQIAEWTSGIEDQTTELVTSKLKQTVFQVKLVERFGRKSHLDWRVLPVTIEESIKWLDPAGYILARSKKPTEWHERYIEEYDFILKPSEEKVVATRYF